MGFIELSEVSYAFPGGRILLEKGSFKVADLQRVAMTGANGAGKTTLCSVTLISLMEESETYQPK